MPTQAPTQAELCVATWRKATRTISLVTVAKRHNATVAAGEVGRRYCFADGSAIHVSGRGQSHRVTTHTTQH